MGEHFSLNSFSRFSPATKSANFRSKNWALSTPSINDRQSESFSVFPPSKKVKSIFSLNKSKPLFGLLGYSTSIFYTCCNYTRHMHERDYACSSHTWRSTNYFSHNEYVWPTEDSGIDSTLVVIEKGYLLNWTTTRWLWMHVINPWENWIQTPVSNPCLPLSSASNQISEGFFYKKKHYG